MKQFAKAGLAMTVTSILVALVLTGCPSNLGGTWEYAEFQYRMDNKCGQLARITLYSSTDTVIDQVMNYSEWDPWGRGDYCTAIVCHARLPWQQLPEGWWLEIEIFSPTNPCDDQVDCCNGNCGSQPCSEQTEPCKNNVPGSIIIAIIDGERKELTWPEALDCSSKYSYLKDGYEVTSYLLVPEMLTQP